MRLIDADAMKDRVKNYMSVFAKKDWREICEMLNNAPTVDAELVRHGHWIFNPKDAIEMMFTLPKCSECGTESSDGGNYCYNCGAKMDKVTDGEIQK